MVAATAGSPRGGSSYEVRGEAARRMGEEATGGYNPNAYAPGVGQKPTPVPAIPESDVGSGGPTGGG